MVNSFPHGSLRLLGDVMQSESSQFDAYNLTSRTVLVRWTLAMVGYRFLFLTLELLLLICNDILAIYV